MDWSLPGSSIHGIFQARVLEWGAIAFSGGLCSGLLLCSLSRTNLPSSSGKRILFSLENLFQEVWMGPLLPIFTDVQETLSWPIRILCALGQTNWIKRGHVTQNQAIRSFCRAFLPKVLGKKLYSFQVASLVRCEPLAIGSPMLTIRRAPGIDRALMILWKSLSNQTYPLDFSVTWVKIFLCLTWRYELCYCHTKPHEYRLQLPPPPHLQASSHKVEVFVKEGLGVGWSAS